MKKLFRFLLKKYTQMSGERKVRLGLGLSKVVELHQKDIKRALVSFTKLSEDFLVQTEDISEAIVRKGILSSEPIPRCQ